MLLFVTVAHLLIAVLLITFVLLQDAKGGGVFGMSGGSNQILSSTGAANLLVRMTRWLAILFAGTCILLTLMTNKDSQESVVDSLVPVESAAPVTQGTPSPGTNGDKANAAGQNSTQQKTDEKK